MTTNQIASYTIYPTIIAGLFFLQSDFSIFSVLMIIIGVIFWNMFEYGFHRFAFHNKQLPKKLKRTVGNGHNFHHRYPDNAENIQLPVGLTLPLSLLSLLLVYLVFGSVGIGWYYLSLILCLFHYEFMHYAAHHWKINSKYFRWMKRYHLLHHHKTPNSRFMVSNPVFDYLFTTHR